MDGAGSAGFNLWMVALTTLTCFLAFAGYPAFMRPCYIHGVLSPRHFDAPTIWGA